MAAHGKLIVLFHIMATLSPSRLDDQFTKGHFSFKIKSRSPYMHLFNFAKPVCFKEEKYGIKFASKIKSNILKMLQLG